jgi:hypothetical protein
MIDSYNSVTHRVVYAKYLECSFSWEVDSRSAGEVILLEP